MPSFDPSEIPFPQTHRLLLGGVAPRPIAFVTTLDNDGRVNLAPFSFFNAFGVNPPVICFSPAFSGKTGNPKDTLLNILETGVCTVSIISYEMVHQASVASAPFERGVDEYIKAGFSKQPSLKVAPPSVAESPFTMEAKLLHHIEFGGKPGSANMLICEVLMMHVKEEVMNESGGIDPAKMDQVARMGGAYYTRAAKGLFQLPQPTERVIGIDSLPDSIRQSSILSGQDLGKLASVTEHPGKPLDSDINERHERAKKHLEQDDIASAWQALIE